jgi:hypothetical protein
LVILALLGCSPEPAPAPLVEMPVARLLSRISLDLRGTRPSPDEIAQVEADPAALDALVDQFLDDDRFPERLVSLYHEIYLTNTEKTDLRPNSIPFDNPRYFYWEVGQEPLRIVAQVAKEDLPYSTIVTADWTMANEDLAQLFPLEWPEGQTGWHKTRYTDGRPAAGVMSTNGLWWRYTTTEANANRRRANALTRILVCEDYLARPIEFDQTVNLLDEGAVGDALESNPGCVNCHVSLDPVASNLFGFYWTNFTSPTEGRYYHPGSEKVWEDLTGVAPGWYGTPTNGLVDLGNAVASDPRFPTCAARQAYERLLRRSSTIDDEDDITALRESFIAGDMKLKALYRAVTQLPVYRAADVDTERGVPYKMMTPDVLGAAVEDLTGFYWERSGYDVMRTDDKGLRSLAGGVEGILIKQPSPTPNSALLLVQEALSYEAASAALASEVVIEPAERRLFTEVDFTETPDTDRAAMVAQIKYLHLRVFGERIEDDSEELTATLALWQELYDVENDVPRAWEGTLVALLRDPEFVMY